VRNKNFSPNYLGTRSNYWKAEHCHLQTGARFVPLWAGTTIKTDTMENILAAVDFSTTSKNAAEYAANLARYFNAKLTLFHAYHIPVLNTEAGYIPPLYDTKKDAEAEIKKWMRELYAQFKGIEIDYVLEMGFAADLIEEVALDRNCDLIVVGLADQGSTIKEHLVGSVATNVAQSSSVPVLIIPEKVKYSRIKKISYACDFDKNLESTGVLMRVKYFCALFDADLQILNVMRPQEEISVEKAETDSYVEEKLYSTKHDTFFIYDDAVDKGVIEFMDHHQTDILITSPKKHNFFHNLFVESKTKKLAFHAHVPVLTVHA
jgi:nucleotide-binding universal stress UspA family protein